MMKMLVNAGLSPVIDDFRKADEDNQGGYFEYEKVKQLGENSSWLEKTRGKLIKIISFYLDHLPDNLKFRVVFMERNIDEILASQKKMLTRRGHKSKSSEDEEMKSIFTDHLLDIKSSVISKPHIELIYVNYNLLVTEPKNEIEKINNFFNNKLDKNKLLEVIDLSQYRNRINGK
ncbi:MAG: sulfotransferase family protein [Halobacteriovoraceae bacterium]|nr:sulfotransferase family protein [Halobacteriovoraceae bacterium]